MKKIKLLNMALGLVIAGSISVFGQQGKPSSAIKENYLNTASTVDANGTKYKLVLIGDLLPKLYVNNRPVSNNDLIRYNKTIEQLSAVIWQRQKLADEKKKVLFEKNTKAIINDLIKRGVVKNENDIVSFRLTAEGFVVNNKRISFGIFTYFKNKYTKSGDEVYYFN
jgi:hypothetical protein